MEPYRLLWRRGCSARGSRMLTAPASTAVTGLCMAAWTLRPFEAAVALAAVLAKFTPLLLSIVPFQDIQTWTTHVVCAWITVAVLALMLVVLVWSLFVPWPPVMLVEPDTLAAAMYYVCDSAMLDDLEHLSTAGARERDRYLEAMGRTYRLGTIAGASSGQKRIAVDYADLVS